MPRLVIIVSLLFVTPAWAADEIIHLDCTYDDGSKMLWRLKPKAMVLEQGYDQYKCKEFPDFYRCENEFGAIGEINRYNLDLWWQSSDGKFKLTSKCKSVEPKF